MFRNLNTLLIAALLAALALAPVSIADHGPLSSQDCQDLQIVCDQDHEVAEQVDNAPSECDDIEEAEDICDPGDPPACSETPAAAACTVMVIPSQPALALVEGGTAIYALALSGDPEGKVVVHLSSGEATVEPSTVTFEAAEWMVPQTVSVTAPTDMVEDFIMGTITHNIDEVATESTTVQEDIAEVALFVAAFPELAEPVQDVVDEFAAITIHGFQDAIHEEVEEAGQSNAGFYAVVLHAPPTHDVVIDIYPSDPADLTINADPIGAEPKESLTFTQANWFVPQIFTATAVSDSLTEGINGIDAHDITFGVTSQDDTYELYMGPQFLDIIDNDVAGLVFGGFPADDLEGNPVNITLDEDGGTATVTVALSSQPTADVVISVATNVDEMTASPATVTFTGADWNTPQDVVLTAVADGFDRDDASALGFAASSADSNYHGQTSAYTVDIIDDDVAVVLVGDVSGPADEAGGTATFTINLNSTPTEEVVVTLTEDTEATVSQATVTFAAGVAPTATTITVTAIDDDFDRDDVATIGVAVTAGAAEYPTQTLANVVVTITDDDTAAVTVVAPALTVLAEDGGSTTFTLALDAISAGDVTIAVTSSTGDATITPASATWTAGDVAAKTFTVTAVPDDIDRDGDTATIGYAVSAASDNYAGLSGNVATITFTDDDAAAFNVVANALTVDETGTQATFTVVLATEPVDDVVIDLSNDDPTEISLDTSDLTFTSANWNSPQTVTVTGVGDSLRDGDQTAGITLSVSATSDSAFIGLSDAGVSVTVTDMDVVILSLSGATQADEGESITFTVTSNVPSLTAIGFDYSTGGGTAQAADFSGGAGSGTIPADGTSTSATFTVEFVTDAIDEEHQTVVVTLTSSEVLSASDSVTVTIRDMNQPPTVRFATADETGNGENPTAIDESAGSGTVTLVLIGETERDVTVNWAITAGSVDSDDYSADNLDPLSDWFPTLNRGSGQVTFLAGVTSMTFGIDITDDDVDETDETIRFGLRGVVNGNLAGTAYKWVISDNDGPTVAMAATAGSGSEARGIANIIVTLDAESVQTVTVAWTATGVGVDENDFSNGAASMSGTLTFEPGQTSKAISLRIANDSDVEGDEVVTVTLSDALDATLGAATFDYTIVDND